MEGLSPPKAQACRSIDMEREIGNTSTSASRMHLQQTSALLLQRGNQRLELSSAAQLSFEQVRIEGLLGEDLETGLHSP